VDLDAEAVTCAVPECLSQPMAGKSTAGRRVDVSCSNTRPDSRDRCSLGVQHRPVNAIHLSIRLPYGDGSSQVDAVSAVDPAKVQHDEVAVPEHPVTRMGMRERRVRPARHDGFEGAPFESGGFDAPVDLRREFLLGHPGLHVADDLDRDRRQ